MGRGRRGPARAGRWPGARRRDVLRGGGWRRGAEGEFVPNPRTEPAKAALYGSPAEGTGQVGAGARGGCVAGRRVTRDDCRTTGASRRHPFCSLTPPNLLYSRRCICELHRSAHVRGKANAARIVAFLGGFSLAIGLDLRLHELLGVRGDQSRHCASFSAS